jgi:hypothetical protein
MILVDCVSCDAEDEHGNENHRHHDQSSVPLGGWRYRGYCRPGRRGDGVSTLGTVSSARRDKRVTVRAGHLLGRHWRSVGWRSSWLLRSGRILATRGAIRGISGQLFFLQELARLNDAALIRMPDLYYWFR